MRNSFIIGLVLWACLAGSALAHNLPECYDPETSALREVSGEELKSHGGSDLGPVEYPAGTTHRNFRFYVSYVVDTDGRVSCMSTAEIDATSRPIVPAEMTAERQALLDGVASTTFTPFVTDGRPEKVLVETMVDEEELPAFHVPRPRGDLASAVIKLAINGHRSPYTSFSMTFKGDGTAIYDPGPYDRLGAQTYRVSPAQVEAMLDLAEKADFWSLRDIYLPEMNPKAPELYSGRQAYYNRVSITFGGRTKSTSIYDWGDPGAPLASRRLAWEMATLGGLDMWQGSLTNETIAQLSKNGFDFTSKEGGELLISVAANSDFPDTEVYYLIAKGAPQNYVSNINDWSMSLLDAAIDGDRTELVDNLITQGALLTHGKPDTGKISRALAQAVAKAAPNMVDKILSYHPALRFRHGGSRCPWHSTDLIDPVVAFVGERREADDLEKDGDIATDEFISVAQRLIDAGADLNSRDACGGNVLTHAIENDHVGFARWLLGKGVSSKRADGSWPDIFLFDDEDMVLLMLEAGAGDDPDIMQTAVDYAQDGDHAKVEAWLKAHGKWPKD